MVAKFSSTSALFRLALSISIGAEAAKSSRLSKMLLVGVGGICGSIVCRAEFDNDDDRLEAALEADVSR